MKTMVMTVVVSRLDKKKSVTNQWLRCIDTMKESQYADHLIDIYLQGLTSVSNDAGWEGDNLMARLIDFHGELPDNSNYCDSNVAMIHAIDRLRKEHALFDVLKRVIGSMLGTYGETDKILALLSKRYYQGVNPETRKAYTNRDRLSKIGYAPSYDLSPAIEDSAWNDAEQCYRRRVRIGRKLLLEKLEKRGIAA